MALAGNNKTREKKVKKEKSLKEKSEGNKRESQVSLTQSRKSCRIHILVCGDPKVVQLYMRQNSELSTQVDQYHVRIDAEIGTDCEGEIVEGDCDLYLCVYDVRDRKSVDFLRKHVMCQVGELKRKCAIAGLGLETRACGGQGGVDSRTSVQLAKEYNCRGSELVYCDPHQLAAGTFSLYRASYPDRFKDPKCVTVRVEGVESRGGEEKTKKEKKAKGRKSKERKPKKD
ncbi:hypothetical protein Aperf_G00000104040 [Anoplocephala perfoliata]